MPNKLAAMMPEDRKKYERERKRNYRANVETVEVRERRRIRENARGKAHRQKRQHLDAQPY